MHRTLKTLAAIGTLVAAIPCWGQAALVTFTTTGTIAAGSDDLGLFVSPGNLLTGRAFSLSISIDTARLAGTPAQNTNYMQSAAGTAAVVTGEATVAGRSYSWIIDNANAYAFLSRRGEGSNGDSAALSGFGVNMRDGMQVDVLNHITPTSASTRIVGKVGFAQEIDFAPYLNLINPEVAFYADLPYIDSPGHPGHSGPVPVTTYFQAARPLSGALWSVSPVPEPASAGMLVFGLGAVCVALRKTRRLAEAA